MNKRVRIIILVIGLAIAGAGAYVLMSSDDKAAQEDMRAAKTAMDQADEASAHADAEAVVNAPAGTYVDYSPSALSESTGTTLLFFHAPWCPQCRALEADIKQRGVPAGVTIVKVDYDSNQALRQQYGVTLQTTIVKVDDEGSLIEKFVAYDDPSLEAIENNLLR